MLAALSILFLVLTGFLVLSVWRRKRLGIEANIPKGYRVFSADLGQEAQMSSRGALPLRDNEWSLAGKVDLLLQHIETRAVIPIDYKVAGQGFEPGKVRSSHMLQLATALVPRGEVHIQNTPEIREWVVATAQRMRRALATTEDLHRDHHSPAKCQRCGLRHLCDEPLGG